MENYVTLRTMSGSTSVPIDSLRSVVLNIDGRQINVRIVDRQVRISTRDTHLVIKPHTANIVFVTTEDSEVDNAASGQNT